MPDQRFILATDTSDTASGAVLQQIQKGVVVPLSFFSQKFTLAECKYSTYDRELTAIYKAIRHFRQIIEGREVLICTDHKQV